MDDSGKLTMAKTPKNKVNQSQEITKTKPVVSKSSKSFMERSQQDLQSFQAVAEHISQAVEALDNKKFDQAIEQFQKAIQQNQESAEAHFYLGLSNFMLEDYEEAVKWLRLSADQGFAKAQEMAKKWKLKK